MDQLCQWNFRTSVPLFDSFTWNLSKEFENWIRVSLSGHWSHLPCTERSNSSQIKRSSHRRLAVCSLAYSGLAADPSCIQALSSFINPPKMSYVQACDLFSSEGFVRFVILVYELCTCYISISHAARRRLILQLPRSVEMAPCPDYFFLATVCIASVCKFVVGDSYIA